MIDSSARTHDRVGLALSSKLALEPAKCAICDGDFGLPHAVGEDFEYHTSNDTFLMMRCDKCELLFLNPRPAARSFSIIYPDDYHAFDFNAEKFGPIHSARRRLEARRLLRWCSSLGDEADILDVGCGDGFHLAILEEFGKPGWRVKGVDMDARAAACSRKRGLNVVHGEVETLPIDETFDLVLLIMTIEHLNNPLSTVSEIVARMKPGAQLVVVTDNAASPDHAIFSGRYWGGYHFPRHTYLFSPATLKLFANRVGLLPISIRTALSPVNWTYSVRNILVDWGSPRWLTSLFSLHSPMGLAAFTILDLPLTWINRGAILHGILQKPWGVTEQ